MQHGWLTLDHGSTPKLGAPRQLASELHSSSSCLSIALSPTALRCEANGKNASLQAAVSRVELTVQQWGLYCCAVLAFNFSVMFVYLEYSVISWSGSTLNMPFVRIDCNVEVPQNGGKMYPSRDVTFHLQLMHSLVPTVRRAIKKLRSKGIAMHTYGVSAYYA